LAPETDRPSAAEPLANPADEHALKNGDAPLSTSDIELPDGVIGCGFCGNTKFRRSRVRIHDVGELLMLRYPLRCTRCNQRQYSYFVTAAYALPPRSHVARVDRGRDTWKAWTEHEQNSPTLQRPMTTSIGPKATKLHPPPSRTPRSRSHGGKDWLGDDDRQIW
jgi:hypothetical protein